MQPSMPSTGAPRRLRLPVSCTILTGALASGKTTAIAGLLRCKPAGEVWAVLVNEFGAAGLDAALLEGGAAGPAALASSTAAAGGAAAGGAAAAAAAQAQPAAGVHIRQLAGGCLCCALSNITALAIAQLLRNVKPDRLLIEPSGLAHPANLLDMLQGGHLGSSLAVGPVVCLVDATQFAGGASTPAGCEASQLLLDQISVADVLVGSKADLCDAPTLAAFRRWASQLFPPKLLVATSAGGCLQDGVPASALLSWPAGSEEGDRGNGSGGGGGAQLADKGQEEQEQVQEQDQQQQVQGQVQQQQQVRQVPVQRVRRAPVRSLWHSSSSDAAEAELAAAAAAAAECGEEPAEPGQPLRKEVQDSSGTYAACGWILHRDCVFNRARLLALLQLLVPRTLRVKGVFRISPKLWVAASASASAAAVQPGAGAVQPGGALPAAAGNTGVTSPGGAACAAGQGDGQAQAPAAAASEAVHVQLREIAYRRDSRVEVILETSAGGGAATKASGGLSGPSSLLEAQGGRLSLAGQEEGSTVADSGTGNSSLSGAGNLLEAQAGRMSLAGQEEGSTRANSAINTGGVNNGGSSGGGAAEQQVLAALKFAAGGDWGPLEALLLATLEPEH